jgi:hypothetical protein
MITDFGSITMGTAVPGAASASLAIQASCDIAAPNVDAQLTAVASFQPVAQVSYPNLLALAQLIVKHILDALAALLEPPDLTVQANFAQDAKVALTASLGAIQAQLAIALALDANLAASLRALAYSGPQNAMGSELAAALGSGSADALAVILVATSPAAQAALSAVFKVS